METNTSTDGLHTQTAGRVKEIEKFLDKDEPFMLTYGDDK